ncbi:hypothetical protein OPQ81_001455 [Rhizoctonia solani]|nr:hypothetical protein OPQ81_001455 [Rhizoctonia solani]
MSRNSLDTSSHADQPVGIEELKRHISKAREKVQAYLGRGDASHWEKLGLAASMLAHAEDLLESGTSQPSSSEATGQKSTSHTSTFISTSDSGSIPMSHATRALSPLSSLDAPVNSTPISMAPQPGISGGVALNLYSEPAIPSDGLTFSHLWKLWVFQNRKARQDIPMLGGKLLDLQLLALNINLLGGQAEVQRDTSLWRKLAVRLRLIESEAQDDEQSRRIVETLQKTQEELLLPFEQYCITWSRLSKEERNEILAKYTTAIENTKANYPSPMPEVGNLLSPSSVILTCGSTVTLAPNSPPELYEAIKLVDSYFQGFYPGVRLYTKIERLLKLPPSELPKHTWTRNRLDFLSRFPQNHAGQTIDQIIACMAVVIQQQLPRKKLIPASEWPVSSVKVTEVLPPTSSAMFSAPLIYQANRFVENTIQAIEEVRPLMKRIELPNAHRQALKALVTEAYDLALFFYHAVALHYMLFLNEKDTRSNMMHAMFIIEQFFLSSTGYPAHIMSLKSAVTSVTSLRDVLTLMRDAYAKRYQYYLRLKTRESQSGSVRP